MKSTSFFLLFCSLVLFSGCSSDDDDITDSNSQIVQVIEVPSSVTGKVGQEIAIPVGFIVYNGCGQFGRFVEKRILQQRLISIEAKYVGDICTFDIPRRDVIYTFTPEATGNYTLRFLTFDGEYLTTTVVVD